MNKEKQGETMRNKEEHHLTYLKAFHSTSLSVLNAALHIVKYQRLDILEL